MCDCLPSCFEPVQQFPSKVLGLLPEPYPFYVSKIAKIAALSIAAVASVLLTLGSVIYATISLGMACALFASGSIAFGIALTILAIVSAAAFAGLWLVTSSVLSYSISNITEAVEELQSGVDFDVEREKLNHPVELTALPADFDRNLYKKLYEEVLNTPAGHSLNLLSLNEIPEALHKQEVFKEYICTFTQSPARFIKVDTTAGGLQVFERTELERYFESTDNPISPTTRAPLTESSIRDSKKIQFEIDRALAHHSLMLKAYSRFVIQGSPQN